MRGGGALPGVRGGLRQQQLLHVGDPLFVDLDAGIGFAEQDVGDAQLLAQAIIVQAAQLQIPYLEQALVVGPIQHVEPRDLESTAYLQLADGPLAIGDQVKPRAAGKLAVPHADAQQMLQVGLGQGQRQPLLADGAVQGEGGQPQGAVKRHRRPGVEGCVEGEGAGLGGLAAKGPQGEGEGGDGPFQGLAAGGFGQSEAALVDAGLLEGPLPGLGGGGRLFAPLGGLLGDQQVREIQLLLLVEDGGDGRALEGGGIELKALLVAIDADPGQRQLLEAGKFLPLVACELPVGQGQLAL